MTIVLFFIVLAVPLVTFNWKENVISEIDNRQLTNNPFGPNYVDNGESLSTALVNYVQDRIGLRDTMIQAYTILNDRLFGELVHPSYTYGKEGHVFLDIEPNVIYGEYHVEFANMLEKIQTYCQERNVPFVFVFEPAKTTVLQDKLPQGVNYNSDWTDEFFKELERRNINYVDNTILLEEKEQEGECVFNQKYDAGHWNDLGAFYGVNNILQNLKDQSVSGIHLNEKDEFTVTETLQKTLKESAFPIHEYVPEFLLKQEASELTSSYIGEVEMDEQNREFRYYVNSERRKEGSPKALVFQGSYMNEMGYKFLENSFGEYIVVHNYQNTMDFDYYFNIFQPECVILEVAEYTFTEDFFRYADMKNMELNPLLSSFDDMPEREYERSECEFHVEQGETLTKISISGLGKDTEYGYLEIDGKIYDLRKSDEDVEEYTVTIENTGYSEDFCIIAVNNREKSIYK